ncbi:hypothetical protein Tco_1386698 [Tanacetum coccineum]
MLIAISGIPKAVSTHQQPAPGLPPTQGLMTTVHDGHIVTEPICRGRSSRCNVVIQSARRQEGDMLQMQRRRTCLLGGEIDDKTNPQYHQNLPDTEAQTSLPMRESADRISNKGFYDMPILTDLQTPTQLDDMLRFHIRQLRDQQALKQTENQLKERLPPLGFSYMRPKIHAINAENAKLKTELSGKDEGRTKPATESRKPMPKSHTRNHRILPSKSVNARRAADHNRKLGDQLERIMEPIVEPLELTPSVSSSSKVTMISRFTDCKLSDRKAGSKGLSGIFEC